MRWGAFGGTLLALTFMATALHANADPSQVGKGSVAKTSGVKKTADPNGLDFGFIENKGQWNEEARYYAGWKGLDVWVGDHGIKYDFFRASDPVFYTSHKGLKKPRTRTGQVVELEFLGAQSHATGNGVGQREGVMNFIRSWGSIKDVRTYNEGWINNLYTGVDMRVYRDQGAPRFDLVVAPGVNPNTIRFRYNGAASARIGDNDTLLVKTRFGEVAITDLYAYQRVANQDQQVQCKFIKNPDGSFSFQVKDYDSGKPLVIDPIVYSTLFGGFATSTPGDDICYDVAVDQFNQAYTCGTTTSLNYPITNGAYDNQVTASDAFVTKFKADASNLIFSTVVGGDGNDEALAIAIDRAGRACITGDTTSPDLPATGAFPTTPNAPQTTYDQGATDAFIARISNDGKSLDFGTYYGAFAPAFPPPPGDFGFDIGVDADDNMYVVGQTEGSDLPVTAGVLQPNYGGSTTDGFAVRISSAGIMDYGTFIGGSAGDACTGVAVDSVGNAYICGSTSSVNFPLVAGSFDTSIQGQDAFVGKLVPTGTSFDYCTAIGGSGGDGASSIALDNQGNTYICGSTSSVDFPRTPGCFDNVYNPDFENFVTKIALDGASLVYSTFMGGGGSQQAIAVDDLGVAYIAGIDNATTGAIQTTATGDDQSYNGPNNPLRIGDAYLQALDEAGSNLLYGSYIGGEEDDLGLGLFVDRSRNAYMVGVTNSWTEGTKVAFPTTPGVFKPAMENDNVPNLPFWDSFLIKIKVRPAPLLQTVTVNPASVAGTEESQMSIALTGPASPGGAVIRISSNNENVAKVVDGSGVLLDQVVVPEGQSTAGPLRIVTSDVVTQFVVTFTVELEGDTKTANITVAPWLTNMILSPNSVVGGNRVTGRVTLFRPAPAGMVVSISSSDVTKAYAVDAAGTRINNFTVPTGNTTATFDILTRGVDAPANVTILAKITTPNLQVTRSQTLRVLPASLRSLTFNQARVNGGETSVGTVLLDGEAGPTPIKVDLSLGTTGNPPVNITLPNPPYVYVVKDANDVEKGKTAKFTVTAGVPTANAFRNVVAKRNNTNPVQTVQGTLFVDVNDIQSITLDSNSVVGGQQVRGHVTLTTPAAPSGFRVKIKTSDAVYAPFGTRSEIDMVIPAGAIRSPDFLITTKLTNTGHTAIISANKVGYAIKQTTLIIRPIALTFTRSPIYVVGGSQNVIGTLTLNENAPTFGVPVSLTSSDTSALTVPAKVNIPEGSKTATFTAVSKSVLTPKSVTMTATIDTIPNQIVKTAQVTVNPLTISLVINPNQVTGGLPTSGTVTVSAPAGPTGIAIALSSSNPAVATVPATVTIPNASPSAAFNINTLQVGADTSVTITARTPAGLTATAALRVLALNLQISVAPNSVVGGVQNSVGTVVISSPAPVGGALITLTSGNTNAATVPASVTVSQGNTSAQFTVTTYQVPTDIVVSISGKTVKGKVAATTMNVLALGIGLSLTPSTVTGGVQNSTGIVTIAQKAPAGGMPITLSSNSPAASVPASVTIPGGATGASFVVSTSAVAVDTNATIQAKLPAGRSAVAVLTIQSPRLVLFTVDSFVVVGGDTTNGQVNLNYPAPAGGVSVGISSGNPGVVQVPASVTVAGGTNIKRFVVTTTSVSNDTNVTLTATFAGQSQSITMQVLAPTLVALSLNPSTVVGGLNVTGTVTIDRPAPAGGMTIMLSKDPNSTGAAYVTVPASVTIPAGAQSANFTIATATVSRQVAAQISATFGSRAPINQVLTINPR